LWRGRQRDWHACALRIDVQGNCFVLKAQPSAALLECAPPARMSCKLHGPAGNPHPSGAPAARYITQCLKTIPLCRIGLCNSPAALPCVWRW
jgi:hypothetical protein